VDDGAQQLVQPLVGACRDTRRSGEHEVYAQAGSGAGRSGEPGVVRPPPARRHERVGILREGRTDEELEIAQLVSPERQRQQVLALGPDRRAASQRHREPLEMLERRRPVEERETRQLGDPGRGHGSMVVRW
jgi:hypothetical protein